MKNTCLFHACAITILATIGVSQQAFAQDDLPNQVVKVLKDRCFRCHGGQSTAAGLDVLSPESLFADRREPDEEEPRFFVLPKDPDKSVLWDAIDTTFMPLDDSPEAEAITDEERAIVKKWIESGAEFPLRKVENVVSQQVAFGAMKSFLDGLPFDDRKYFRFLSIAALHNNPKVSLQDLRIHRAAMIKVLNSLVFKTPKVMKMTAVQNTQDSIFAIDLRDLDWDRNNKWQLILDQYPYGAQYEFSQNRELRDLYNEVQQKCGTAQPMIRGDWFVFYATQHPLYTQLLELPRTLDQLSHSLGIDIEDNFRNAKIARAGFSKSGVSRQNRLVERHEGSSGYVWVSYDFKPRRAKGDLPRFPLGPKFDRNPFNRHAFDHDGGEVIFRLPNGLQGYMLVDGEGVRLDVPAPADVVFDTSGVTGSTAILNGISCMNCHARGMISGFRDDVRESHAIGGPAQLFLEKIYPPHEKMQEYLKLDRESYIAAETRITSKYLEEGDAGEPVGKVATRYVGTLDVDTAAYELDLADGKTLQSVIKSNRELIGLGLGRLTQDPPSTIQRAIWESSDGLSYFQEIYKTVQPGTMPIAAESRQ